MDKMLQTFKRHLDGIEDVEEIMLNAGRQTKLQSHKFGEGIKAINEFVGCMQILNSRLTKLQLLVSKIEFSREDVKTNNDSAAINVSEILISQAKELIDTTKFVDRELFNSDLSAKMGGFEINFQIQNPKNMLDSSDLKNLNLYIDSKKEEIKACLEVVKALTYANENQVESGSFKGKTIKEALSML